MNLKRFSYRVKEEYLDGGLLTGCINLRSRLSLIKQIKYTGQFSRMTQISTV